MEIESRKTGIDIIGDVPWGTHLCQFYKSKEELIDILVPYFKAGLENNEFCMWVTSEPLGVKEAQTSLKKAVKHLDSYIKSGQMEILEASDWYTKSGKFDLDGVLQGWLNKENQALERGFDGLRLTGGTSWLLKEDWEEFFHYEAIANNIISNKRMLAICCYSLDRCGVSEVVDVANNHVFTLIRRDDRWRLVQNTEHKRVKEALQQARSELEKRVAERTADLETIAQQLRIDIAERKRTEEELIKSNEFNFNLIEQSPHPILVIEADSTIVRVNQALEKLTGYSSSELIGLKIPYPWWTEQYKRWKFTRDAKAARERKGQTFEERFRNKNGEIFWVEVTPTAIMIGEKPDYYLIIWADVTERKLAEEELRESQGKLSSFIQSTMDVVALFDSKLNLIEINEAGLKMFPSGTKRKDVIGKNVVDFYPEIKKAGRYDNYMRVIKTGEPLFLEDAITDPKFADMHVSVKAFKVGDGLGLMVSDITERVRLEEELQRTAKLEALSNLAGGIAHDFNNILAGIMGNISLAKTYLEPGEEVFETLVEAEKACLRSTDLTQQLLTFAKGGVPIKKTTSLVELIKDSANFALSGSNVRCEFYIPDDLWRVEIDEGQISQVISNLVINADEAMPEGGVSNIRAQNTTIAARDVLPLPEGNYVKINVEDHGSGIPKKQLSQIFDPFFTTKQKGSGLGLSTAYSIVKKHDGHIAVTSKLGVGTTFCVYLPASEKPVPMQKAVREIPAQGKGRILAMDDEESIRKLLSRMLTKLGYEVELVRDGIEAVKQYQKAKESGQPFDVVVLDLTVSGGLGGKESLKRLLEIDPSIKAIVSSGYATDPIVAKFKEYGFRGVVTKPYRIDELKETLNKVLTGTAK